MLNFTLVGGRELVARIDAMPGRMRAALHRRVSALTLKLEARVKAKLSGQVLKVQTGALRRSIFSRVQQTAGGVIGTVASSGDVKYAAIHEFGGKTPPRVITPVRAKALAFMVGGKQVFAARVNHPGSVIPERSFLRSSLGEMEGEIRTSLKQAILDGMKDGGLRK